MASEMDVVLAVGKDFDIDEALSIYTSKIWINDWVSMKYKYDNDDCSHLVSTEQTKKLIREYKRAVLVIGKKMDDFKVAVLAMEKELVKNGYYKALALINGPCDFCGSVEINPDIKKRPCLEQVGIDIHATVRKFKKNTEPPKEGELRPYAIILVE